MDNAPSHPPTFQTAFFHVKVLFLPKNNTSKLQPLDAGMIKNFKIHYRKQLLQHVVSRVTPGSKASDIIDSVDILMAIRWTMNAWESVEKQTIRNCFAKCGFFDSDFQFSHDKEIENELNDLIAELSTESRAPTYLMQDDGVATSAGTIDPTL